MVALADLARLGLVQCSQCRRILRLRHLARNGRCIDQRDCILARQIKWRKENGRAEVTVPEVPALWGAVSSDGPDLLSVLETAPAGEVASENGVEPPVVTNGAHQWSVRLHAPDTEPWGLLERERGDQEAVQQKELEI